MTVAVTLRAVKGSMLTHQEVDDNFADLRDGVNANETAIADIENGTTTNITIVSPTITGGTIDNTTIGGTTPAAGTFTTLIAAIVQMTGLIAMGALTYFRWTKRSEPSVANPGTPPAIGQAYGWMHTDGTFRTEDGDGVTSETVITSFVAVGDLPAAAASGGRRFMVNDANVVASGNFGAVVAGGGANRVPVYSDATNWRIG